MKKRHLLVICTLATLSMAACSTENKIITTTNTEKTTESNKITNSNEKFRDFELSITVDSKSITLPCTYQEFSDLIGESYQHKEKIEENTSETINYMNTKEKVLAWISVFNPKDVEIPVMECMVTSIDQNNMMAKELSKKIKFADDYAIGDKITEEDIVKKFGEPQEIKEYKFGADKVKRYKYYFSDKNGNYYFAIGITEGTISRIMMGISEE